MRACSTPGETILKRVAPRAMVDWCHGRITWLGCRLFWPHPNVSLLIDVLVALSADHGWEPVYCVSYGLQDKFKRHFPSGIYHDTHDARYGRPAPDLAGMPLSVLDQPAAEALGYAQVLALKQM